MANKTISDLTSGDPAQGSDAIPVQRGASNFKLTMSAVAAFTGANGPNIASKTIPANLTGSSAPALPATLLAIINALQPTGKKWYVDSVNGNDSNSGTSPFNPFATVTHAQDIAATGDTVFLNDGYSQSTLFTVTKNLIFCSEGRVNFTGGVTIGSVNTRWEGYFYLASTNRPSLEFTEGSYHFFDKISYYTTYATGATQTITSSILIASGAKVFIGSVESADLVTPTGIPVSVVRATHIYTTGSGSFDLTIANSTNLLSRYANGIKYNIYYSDATSVYSTANLNNFEIKEYSLGQSDSTVNDLFAGGNNYGHSIFVNNVSYSSQSTRIAGPKIRIANSDGGLYRCSVIVNGLTIEPANLIDGDILLSNATSASDLCSVINCTILGSFTLPVSGTGTNTYLYYDFKGKRYSSSEVFNVVVGDYPIITNNSIIGSIQVQNLPINAGQSVNFMLENSYITPDTPVTFNQIMTGVPGVNLVMTGINISDGDVKIFLQNLGTVNHTGPFIVDFHVRTNYNYES